MKAERIRSLARYLPARYERAVADTDDAILEVTEEVRLREGSPPYLYTADTAIRLDCGTATREDMRQTLLALTQHTPYNFEDSLRRGYHTVAGARIGIACRFTPEGRADLSRVYGINIRIPERYAGICDGLLPHISLEGRLLPTLIFSQPCMGKTTLIRDIACAVSNGGLISAARTVVIDERGEIYGNGTFPLGEQCDVISDLPKAAAISMAVRALSPQVLITDELYGEADAEAAAVCAAAGVTVAATAHAASSGELLRRAGLAQMAAEHIFRRYVQLGMSLGRITAEAVYNANMEALPWRALRLLPRC